MKTSTLLILLSFVALTVNAQTTLLNQAWSAEGTDGWTLEKTYTMDDALPSGFTLASSEDNGATLQYKASAYATLPGLRIVPTLYKSTWFAYSLSGLTIGKTYELKINAMVQNSNIKMAMYAWETNNTNIPNVTVEDEEVVADHGSWTDYNIMITATSETMTFGAGVYRVTGNPQLYISSINISETTSTNINNTKDEELVIYPNPVNDIINISNVNSNSSINIYNTSGHLIKTQEAISTKMAIDISDQPNGVYIVKNGTQVQRVIKK